MASRRWIRWLPLVLLVACRGPGAHPGGDVLRAEPAVVPLEPLDTLALVMRQPSDPYRFGPAHPEWAGRAVATATRLEFVFPAVAADNVGCAAVDTLSGRAERRYHWTATADFPDAQYPYNHFMDVSAHFWLDPEALPTPGRLDSAFAATRVLVGEYAGEPPMMIRQTAPARTRVRREATALDGRSAWRVRIVVEGRAAAAAFLAAGADSVNLLWCQRDQWLTGIHVPLERR